MQFFKDQSSDSLKVFFLLALIVISGIFIAGGTNSGLLGRVFNKKNVVVSPINSNVQNGVNVVVPGTEPTTDCDPTSGNIRYCNEIFTSSQIAMTTYKYTDDIEDVDTTQKIDLYMDVYMPTGDTVTNRPFAIYTHAGGGTRTTGIERCKNDFAPRGIPCFSIDFRGTVGNEFTGYEQKLAVSDDLAALRYIRMNASTFGIDPNRAILFGTSAGGVTALQSALAGNNTTSTNFFPTGDPKINRTNQFGVVPSWVCMASSNSGAANSSALNLADVNDPPAILYHGDQDITVPYSGAVATVATMTALGIPSYLYTFYGVGHSLGNADIIETDLFKRIYDEMIVGNCPQEYSNLITI